MPFPSGAPCLLFSCGRRAVLSCLLRVSRACFLPVSPPCLLAIRSVLVPCSFVVSFGSPFVRQVWRGDSGLRLGLGSPRSLLPVACRVGAVDVAGRFLSSLYPIPPLCRWHLVAACFSSPPLLAVSPFYRAGVVLSCRLLVLACFALVVVGRHGLVVVGVPACRQSSLLVVVPVLLARGCRRHPCSPRVRHPLLIASLIVSPLVSPLVLSSRLACREAERLGVAGSLPSLGGGSSYSFACLPFRYPAGDGVAVGMAGRGCFSSVPRGSCGLPLRVRLSVGSAALVARLVVCLAAPCGCLAACGGRGRLVLASRSPSIRISPRLPCREAGRYFLLLPAFPLFR